MKFVMESVTYLLFHLFSVFSISFYFFLIVSMQVMVHNRALSLNTVCGSSYL